ncbi:MAG: sulfurtransferase TusA family protein [Rhodobacterales bacterium]|nr:sulfurtransferase TusA family protein [Rhodobacterales bacterium]
MAKETLDVRGMSCPLPILRATKAMKELIPGDLLTVLATDRDAPQDFVSYCDVTGNELVDTREDNGIYVIVLRRT